MGLAAAWLGCGGGGAPEDEAAAGAPSARLSGGPYETAVVEIEGMGEIRIELLPELAPKTVANFKQLAEQGFYDGTSFHRVIPGFMIQGGDPNTKNLDPRDDGQGGPGYKLEDEFTDYRHVRGTVSMANTGFRNSGGSQFFIVHEDAPHLDGRYAAFGRVVAGMDVVDAITRVEIDKYGRYGPTDRPYPEPVTIASVRIEPPAPTGGVAQK